MTIQLEITNKDTNRILVVTQKDNGSPSVSPPTEIAPGKSVEFYVWTGHELIITERTEETSAMKTE